MNARNYVKDTTHNSMVFFVLFSLILLQQVFCNIPANQIIISTFSQLLYNLVLKNHKDNVLGEVFLLN